MRKVGVEVYGEILSTYFVPLSIHDCQNPVLLKKMTVESYLFQICIQLRNM